MAEKYLYNKNTGKSLLITPENESKAREAYMSNKDLYELQISEPSAIEKSLYTLKMKDQQGREVFQDVEIEDPKVNPENLRSIATDLKNAGMQVINFEPKGQSEQKQIAETEENISPIFGRSGMEYLKHGSPIKAGIVGGLTAIPRALKTGIELTGQGVANALTPFTGGEMQQPENVALSSLAGKPSDSWMGNKLTGITEDPTLVPSSMVGGALLKTLGGLGKLARGAIAGTAEAGTGLGVRTGLGEDISGGQVAKELALGSLFGAGGEKLGDALQFGAGKLSDFVKTAAGGGAGRAGLTGVSKEALEMASTKEGRELLVDFAGRDMEVANELIGVIDNFEKYIPEWKSVQNSISKMPDVDISNVNTVIENSLIRPKGGRSLLPWEKRANSAIMAEFDYNINDLPFESADVLDEGFYKQLAGSGGVVKANLPASSGKMTMSAEGVYDTRKALDKEISPEAFAGISNANAVTDAVMRAKSKVRRELKESLVRTAEQSGNAQYVADMKTLANKLDKKEKLTQAIGIKEGTRQKRADVLVNNITNKSKKRAAVALQELDDLIGTNLTDKARAVQYSQQFGEKGTPSLFPTGGTGKYTAIQVPATLGLASPLINSRAYFPAVNTLENMAQTFKTAEGTPLMNLLLPATRNITRPRAENDTLGSMAQ